MKIQEKELSKSVDNVHCPDWLLLSRANRLEFEKLEDVVEIKGFVFLVGEDGEWPLL